MSQHKELFALSVAVFLLMFGDGMVLALLPNAVISLTHSSQSVWYLAATYASAQVLSQLPGGVLADRWSAKPFLLFGYLLSCVAGLLFSQANEVSLIFWGRVLQGIGEAPLLSLAPAMLSVRYSVNKGKAIGIYNAAIYLGLTIGPFCRIMLLEDWPEQQIFLLYAVLCLIGAVILGVHMKIQPDGPSPVAETISISAGLALIKCPRVVAVLWGIALYGAGFGLFMTVIPAYLLTVRSYSQAGIDIFFSLFYVAISLAQLITGWLSDRLGRQLFMVTGMLAAAAGISVTVYLNQLALTLTLCFAGFGLGVYYLASMAFLTEQAPPGFKGAVAGIYYLSWGIGMFWGPLLLTGYIRASGYEAGFQMVALMLLLQVILLFGANSRRAGQGMPN
jgi:MFS family permease